MDPAGKLRSSTPRKLLVATDENIFSRHTGYTLLAKHTPNAKLLMGNRMPPKGFSQRGLVWALSRFAFTRWYWLGSLLAEWKAWQECRTGRWDLIHVLWGDRDLGFLDLVARICGVPLCVTVHACPDTLPNTLVYSGRMRSLDGIILVSEVQRGFFASRGVAADRIHVVHHGVDCEFFKPAKRRLALDCFTVIHVGNYRRNFPLLREVCMRLMPHSGIRARIVAPQDKAGWFSDLPNVEFVSDLTDEALLHAYQQSSCLLMTVEAATANNTILEALACGLPLVVENVGGIAEYTGLESARLCRAGDAEELAAAVVELSRNPELCQAMSVRARLRAEALNWPEVQRRTEAVYAGVLSRFRTPTWAPSVEERSNSST